MILRFRTKPNYYGNSYYLYIDTENKEYSKNGSSWKDPDNVFLIRKEMKKIENQLLDAGYIETDRWM